MFWKGMASEGWRRLFKFVVRAVPPALFKGLDSNQPAA